MLHHTGDPLSSIRGRQHQSGVSLVAPLAVRQHLSGRNTRGHLLAVISPAHRDLFGVEPIHTALQHCRMFAIAGDDLVQLDVGLSWDSTKNPLSVHLIRMSNSEKH